MTSDEPAKTPSPKRQLRSLARLLAVQALFEIEASRRRYGEVVNDFLSADIGYLLGADIEPSNFDRKYFKLLIETAVSNQVRIDKAVDAALVEKWKLGKVDPTIRAIFRAAGAEFVLGKAPYRVVITEFMNVTRAFTDEKDMINFANAMLDHMRAGLEVK